MRLLVALLYTYAHTCCRRKRRSIRGSGSAASCLSVLMFYLKDTIHTNALKRQQARLQSTCALVAVVGAYLKLSVLNKLVDMFVDAASVRLVLVLALCSLVCRLSLRVVVVMQDASAPVPHSTAPDVL